MFILIAGRRRSGKTSTGKLLADKLSQSTTITHFADPLKEECIRRYNFSDNEVDHDKDNWILDWDVTSQLRELKNEYPDMITFRDVIRRVAKLEIDRHADPKHWAKLAMDGVAVTGATGGDYVIIPDWRFVPEIETVQERFPESEIFKIRITNPNCPEDTHPSECQHLSDHWDYEVYNEGKCISDLDSQIVEIVTKINNIKLI